MDSRVATAKALAEGTELTAATFRFNRRTSKARGLLFYRLVTQAVRTPHVDTDSLFRGTGRGRLSRRNAPHKG
jgi:hypothetical protein